MDMSVSPGMAVNALPRSCALTLSSTEWQQALTASLNQRNLHTMAPTLGSVGPLKMDRSIYIDRHFRLSILLQRARGAAKDNRGEARQKDKAVKE